MMVKVTAVKSNGPNCRTSMAVVENIEPRVT
jgi:hypothetical protein